MGNEGGIEMRNVNLYFSETIIDSYVSAVASTIGEVDSAKYEVQDKFNDAMSRISDAIDVITKAIDDMHEDRRVAQEVKLHNEKVLEQLKEELKRLENLSVELQKAQSAAYDAYRRAAAEETRIHNSPPKSTGDPEADRSAKRAWEQSYAAAQRAVRAADSAYYQAKQAYQNNINNIQTTKRNIEQVEQVIRNLQSFIYQLDDNINRYDSARRDLQSTRQKLQKSYNNFQSVSYNTESNLGQCKDMGNQASGYARDFCNALAPNHNGAAYSSDPVAIYDLDALDNTAKMLSNTCETLSEENDVMSVRKNAHQRTMQDAVIAEAAYIISEEQSTILAQLSELREKAQDCKDASRSLHHYYSLSSVRLR